MRVRWGFRTLAVIWGVLQFALPAAASFADARLERESMGARVAHVEAHSTAACRPEHSSECVLCQSVGRVAERSDPTPPAVAVLRGAYVPVGAPEIASSSHGVAHPDARGPPLG